MSGNGRVLEQALKLLVLSDVRRRNKPFFQTSGPIAAILRANLSSATCCFISWATQASWKFWKGPAVAAAKINQATSAESSKMQSQQRSWPPHTGHSSKSQLGT